MLLPDMVPGALGLILLTAGPASGGTAPPSRAVAATPESELPSYSFAPSAFPNGFWREAPSWLIFGLEQRVRYEGRSGLPRERRDATHLDLGLSRTRLFLGIVPGTAPLQFFLEAQDARQFASDLPATAATVNDLDLLQLRVDLDLDRLVRAPVRVGVGRSSFDAVDRRLIARNRFRNTTNAFDGVRVALGRKGSALGAEVLALAPTERRTNSLDRPADDRRLLGVLGRMKVSAAIVEPYYLWYQSRGALPITLGTAGIHLFGTFNEGRFDHDFDFAFQGGTQGERAHRAFAVHAEVGRTFVIPSSARVAFWFNYATGDRDPDDDRDERFEPLFGASHTMYGFTDLFAWQNLINPTIAVSFRPRPALRAELFYRLYWLASPRDALVRGGLVDPAGESGSFVGQGIDVSIRYRVARVAELDLQYGQLVAGSFVDRTGNGNGARVVFASVVLGTGGK